MNALVAIPLQVLATLALVVCCIFYVRVRWASIDTALDFMHGKTQSADTYWQQREQASSWARGGLVAFVVALLLVPVPTGLGDGPAIIALIVAICGAAIGCQIGAAEGRLTDRL